jgi:signal transduction histidine kinase
MIKYSRASHVGIALDLADDMLVLTITDNGIGFNPKEVDQEKNGLLNMRKRMKEIGGKFILETSEGSGTSVCFNIPLSVN